MKHGLNPLYHWIKHVMINETWFKPSLLTKRFPLGTEWDLHDFLGPLPSFPCITWLPKTFSFRYRMGHSWLPCWDDIHAKMTSMLRWHSCWDDIHTEMTSMLRWHPCWDDIHAEMTSMLRWHPCWDDIHADTSWYILTLDIWNHCLNPLYLNPLALNPLDLNPLYIMNGVVWRDFHSLL